MKLFASMIIFCICFATHASIDEVIKNEFSVLNICEQVIFQGTDQNGDSCEIGIRNDGRHITSYVHHLNGKINSVHTKKHNEFKQQLIEHVNGPQGLKSLKFLVTFTESSQAFEHMIFELSKNKNVYNFTFRHRRFELAPFRKYSQSLQCKADRDNVIHSYNEECLGALFD